MTTYKMIRVPGTSLEIETLDQANMLEGNHTRAPEWMIKMDDLLVSEVEVEDDDGKSKTYCELFGWHAETNRNSSGARSSQRYTTAAIQHSNVTVIIAAGSFFPILEQKQNKGEPIEKIRIVRLAHIRETKRRLQQITFGQCYIVSIKQKLDQIFVEFEVANRENKSCLYDNDGNPKGSTVTGFDYISNAEAQQ